MQSALNARTLLFWFGITAIAMSILLDKFFATDTNIDVPEPSVVSLLAVGGVVGIAAAVIRRRKK
jgi:hypothetical protein